MNMRDLIPWGRERAAVPYEDPWSRERGMSGSHPFLALHREMNRLFDDLFRGFDMPSTLGRMGAGWPSIELSETDKELKLTAELPGLEEKDVEVLLDDGMLTIKGEKRSEGEDKDKGSRFSERFYGRFSRQIPIGDVDESKIDASFKNGVLTVTLPKTAQAQQKAKRIPVNAKEKTKH
jgi:HSP20 family protein